MVETAAPPNGLHRRWIPSSLTFLSTHKTLFTAFSMVFFFTLFYWQRDTAPAPAIFVFRRPIPQPRQLPNLRAVVLNLTDFGGVGDGVTLNTAAFERAVMAISKLGRNGGGQLNVPPGKWLTAPFNLTSHMTLFLSEGAVILGIDDENYWPLMPPLPSYGYGREHPGPRYGSLIHGQNLKDIVITERIGQEELQINAVASFCGDCMGLSLILLLRFIAMSIEYPNLLEDLEVIEQTLCMKSQFTFSFGCAIDLKENLSITTNLSLCCGDLYVCLDESIPEYLFVLPVLGHNGTINGQGQTWWKKYRRKLLNHTRGPLVQIMWSSDILISNITLRDSPFWTLHPYDCKNVTIKSVTILAPIFEAPNTDGIDPDSCEDMVIEDCYISVGDDGVAIKSGWDQYGITYGRPSTNILIRNLVIRSMVSAGISIGSEMSGGVSNVTIENLHVWNSRRAVRIKTAPGRGGYIRHISYRNLTFDNVRVGIVIKTDYNEHPDEGFDPKAAPVLEDISYTSVHGEGVRVPVRIHGSEQIPVRNVTFRDMSVGITYKKKHIFQCSFVQGRVVGTVFPAPCDDLDLYDEGGHLIRRSASKNVSDIDYDF